MTEETSIYIINALKEYINLCPYLKIDNVDLISDEIYEFSISKSPGFKIKIDGTEDILGNYDCQYLFNIDANLPWNEEIENNVNNQILFEKIEKWLFEQNDKKVYPILNDDEHPYYIGVITSGYIYNVDIQQATYRISCILNWRKEVSL